MNDELSSLVATSAGFEQGLGIDKPLALRASGSTYYYQADGLGSTTSLSNSAGALANTYVYDSFGNLTSSAGSVTNPYQFTARELDSETGLYYYRARYYDPTVGRFLSEDPIGFIANVNFYAFVGNNPARLIDPFGLVGISYDTAYFQRTFWQAIWHGGDTVPGEPHVSGRCECEGNSKYKLNINIQFPIRIYYTSQAVRAHEMKHEQLLESFFNAMRGQFEKFEQTYTSRTECEYYRGKYATGFPDNGRVPDVLKPIDQTFPELNTQENAVDKWYEKLIYHR